MFSAAESARGQTSDQPETDPGTRAPGRPPGAASVALLSGGGPRHHGDAHAHPPAGEAGLPCCTGDGCSHVTPPPSVLSLVLKARLTFAGRGSGTATADHGSTDAPPPAIGRGGGGAAEMKTSLRGASRRGWSWTRNPRKMKCEWNTKRCFLIAFRRI